MNPSGMLRNMVTVTPKTQGTGTYGDTTFTAGTAATIPMSIQAQSSSLNGQFDRFNGQRAAIGYAMYANRAYLVNGNRISFDGKTWEVQGSWRNVAGLGVMVECDLVEFVG